LESRGDPAKCLEYFHEDAVFYVLGRLCDYSASGVFRGREQILSHFRRIDSEVECSERKILNLVVEGDKVGVRRSVVVRHHGTAAVSQLVFADFVKFRDSKIVEVFEYADTAWLKRLSGDED
jgi:ketosteroid isomerase-like protein